MNISQAPVAEATIAGVDLVGCLVKDADRAVAFYRDVLGMVPTEIDDQGRGAEFTLADGSTFGVWRPDEDGKGMTVMFAVGDAGEAVKVMRERGATLSDPMETPVCYMSFGSDPDGNGFIIHQRKTQA